jgi:hypothetical protein
LLGTGRGSKTLLFLQALELIAVATFVLERTLPYEQMLIVTGVLGVLVMAVLVILVGKTTRTLQGVGWVPIPPIDGTSPTGRASGLLGGYVRAERLRKPGRGKRPATRSRSASLRRSSAARVGAGADAAGAATRRAGRAETRSGPRARRAPERRSAG